MYVLNPARHHIFSRVPTRHDTDESGTSKQNDTHSTVLLLGTLKPE